MPLEEAREMPIAEAQKLGAMALFGEKYGEEVRVIRFGSSAELCGGTHVQATGEIGAFRIVAESSIAAGIRRIEAITGEGADDQYFSMQDELKNIRALFNNSPQLTAAIEKLVSEHQEAQKKLEALMAERTLALKQSLLQNARTNNGIKLVVFEGEATPDAIKQIAFQLRGEQPEGLAFIAGSLDNGKPLLTVAFSDDLVAKGLNAGQLVREAAKAIQGGGGGQPHFATAGGKHVSGLKEAVNQLVTSIG
ncbi:MAG: Alanine--tRNA ligase [Bacteroidetes bacterium ADurb.Bin416]|nr:MAG: Alanine--tRNA ligase [Bacteroidetes bacterium ADurb.Bin416]